MANFRYLWDHRLYHVLLDLLTFRPGPQAVATHLSGLSKEIPLRINHVFFCYHGCLLYDTAFIEEHCLAAGD